MTYDEQHAAIVADLKGKVERKDWHGVSDAANDLRVLEATGPSLARCSAWRQDGHTKRHCTFSHGHQGPCLFEV